MKKKLLAYCSEHANDDVFREFSANPHSGVFLEITKLALNEAGDEPLPLDREAIRDALQLIAERKDCADFTMTGILRILYQYPDSTLLDSSIKQDMKEAVLSFKYWVDEIGKDGMCMHTENHMILFHSNQLLAGQLYPELRFANSGKTGREHIAQARQLITKWLEWRARFGFSEWNSRYYNEDLLALLNLYDFSQDDGIQSKSGQLIDLITLQIALGSFKGVFGGSRGRAYADSIMAPERDSLGAISHLLWGKGHRNPVTASIMLAVSSYEAPALIRELALDEMDELETYERHSLTMDEAISLGMNPEDLRDLWFFWGAQLYDHRKTIDTVRALTATTQYQRSWEFNSWWLYYQECERLGVPYDADPNPHALTKADIYTYRTPDYMLSCAQDYRKGKQGYQQHIWQATLGGEALVFTGHPSVSTLNNRIRPNYWHGNMILPRAAAYKNVMMCIYWSKPDRYITSFTHAYFPCAAFDETREQDGWVFGRKGNGYIALRSLAPAEWRQPEDLAAIYQDVEWARKLGDRHDLVARGYSNVWICEMGNASSYPSFNKFVEDIVAAKVEGDAVSIQYGSPSLGAVQFGWKQQFKVGGQTIALSDYPRLSNPYCHTEFDSLKYDIRFNGQIHSLDFT